MRYRSLGNEKSAGWLGWFGERTANGVATRGAKRNGGVTAGGGPRGDDEIEQEKRKTEGDGTEGGVGAVSWRLRTVS